MATRSMIGVALANREVQAIYCHWDGYPEHHLTILNEHYKYFEDACSLMDLGDLSSLGETLDTCVAYHRDRGEPYDDVKYKTYKINERWDRESYNYLYTIAGKWILYHPI